MSRVFIVQENLRRDDQGMLSRVFDLAPAEEYGKLVFLLSPDKLPLNLQPIVAEIRRKLADFTDDDFLLCIGDPIAIGLSSIFAAMANRGRIKFLKWVPKLSRYRQMEVDAFEGMDLYDDEEEEETVNS